MREGFFVYNTDHALPLNSIVFCCLFSDLFPARLLFDPDSAASGDPDGSPLRHLNLNPPNSDSGRERNPDFCAPSSAGQVFNERGARICGQDRHGG